MSPKNKYVQRSRRFKVKICMKFIKIKTRISLAMKYIQYSLLPTYNSDTSLSVLPILFISYFTLMFLGSEYSEECISILIRVFLQSMDQKFCSCLKSFYELLYSILDIVSALRKSFFFSDSLVVFLLIGKKQGRNVKNTEIIYATTVYIICDFFILL